MVCLGMPKVEKRICNDFKKNIYPNILLKMLHDDITEHCFSIELLGR